MFSEGLISVIFSLYIHRTGYRKPLYAGIFFLTTGVFLLAINPLTNISPYVWLSISVLFIGAGIGMISPATRKQRKRLGSFLILKSI